MDTLFQKIIWKLSNTGKELTIRKNKGIIDVTYEENGLIEYISYFITSNKITIGSLNKPVIKIYDNNFIKNTKDINTLLHYSGSVEEEPKPMFRDDIVMKISNKYGWVDQDN